MEIEKATAITTNGESYKAKADEGGFAVKENATERYFYTEAEARKFYQQRIKESAPGTVIKLRKLTKFQQRELMRKRLMKH